MTPWARSGAFAATIFAVGLWGAVSPILLRERRGAHRERLLSLGSVFGAGVFLSAGFVHMLADAAQDLDGGADDREPRCYTCELEYLNDQFSMVMQQVQE